MQEKKEKKMEEKRRGKRIQREGERD